MAKQEKKEKYNLDLVSLTFLQLGMALTVNNMLFINFYNLYQSQILFRLRSPNKTYILSMRQGYICYNHKKIKPRFSMKP